MERPLSWVWPQPSAFTPHSVRPVMRHLHSPSPYLLSSREPLVHQSPPGPPAQLLLSLPLRTELNRSGEQRLHQGQDARWLDRLHILRAPRSAGRLLRPFLLLQQVQQSQKFQCPTELSPSSRYGIPGGRGAGTGVTETLGIGEGGCSWKQSCVPQPSLCFPAAPAPGDVQCPICVQALQPCPENLENVTCPNGTTHCYSGFIRLSGGEG